MYYETAKLTNRGRGESLDNSKEIEQGYSLYWRTLGADTNPIPCVKVARIDV